MKRRCHRKSLPLGGSRRRPEIECNRSQREDVFVGPPPTWSAALFTVLATLAFRIGGCNLKHKAGPMMASEDVIPGAAVLEIRCAVGINWTSHFADGLTLRDIQSHSRVRGPRGEDHLQNLPKRALERGG